MSLAARLRDLGGPRNILRQLVRMKDMRSGTCVGEDENGNKYYEDFSYVFGMRCLVMTHSLPNPRFLSK
jgi:hypothetical protein